MEGVNLNLVKQQVDKLHIENFKNYNLKSKQEDKENTTNNTNFDTMSITSERDKKLNYQFKTLKDEINFNTNVYDNLKKIREDLETIAKNTNKIKNLSNNEEKAGLQQEITDKIKEINSLSSKANSQEGRVLEKYTTEKLGISNIDFSSKEGMAKLETVIFKVKTEEEQYMTKINKNNETLKSLYEKKELYSKADELIKNLKNDIYNNSITALLAQSSNLNLNSVYSLLTNF